ncbi:MAG: M15 family metallopeptidase [Christensenellales bacterium]
MLIKLATLLAIFLSLGQVTIQDYAQQRSLGGLLFLVNRDYPLSERYVPEGLVRPAMVGRQSDVTLKAEAAAALEQLFTAAREEAGHRLIAVSGYRSYLKQRAVFRRKAAAVGEEAALLLVAPPGTSEHQLGLAVDIGRKADPHLVEDFGQTPEGRWVADNAHRFGYIVRYRAQWTSLTGYADEPWHIRYVGTAHAGRLHDLGIPLESYVEGLGLALAGHQAAEVGP